MSRAPDWASGTRGYPGQHLGWLRVCRYAGLWYDFGTESLWLGKLLLQHFFFNPWGLMSLWDMGFQPIRPMRRESKPMTNTPTAPVVTQKVRATVNQRRFFELQGQLYKSSYSFLGELMQNARRAGASAVHFTLDEAANSLTCSDDGIGVENFQNLVDLATSGWQDETIQLSEKPFGMGFFSLFYACDEVTVSSRGQVLTIRRDDIIQQRELHVHAEASAQPRGTAIRMCGLNMDPWKLRGDWHGAEYRNQNAVVIALRKRASGFDIPVYCNGEELPAPYARRNITGEMTNIGFVSSGYAHNGKCTGHEGKARCFLQGLPVSDDGANIVHLDTDQFVPVMPDRASLQDHHTQIERVRQAIRDVDRRFLVAEKQRLSGEDFVKKHFAGALELQPELLNDIAFLPRGRLSYVESVAADAERVYTTTMDDKLVSRQEIMANPFKVWRDAPYNSLDYFDAPLLLKVMSNLEIADISTKGLDGGHWIFQCTPAVEDMRVQLVRGSEIGRSGSFWIGNHDAALVIVDTLALQVTSTVEPEMNITCTLQDDWVVTSDTKGTSKEEPYAADFSDGNAVFYVVGSGSPDVEALSNFRGENDDYDESWAEGDQRQLNSRLAAITGRHVSASLQTALNNAVEHPNGKQVEQICVIRSVSDFQVWRGRTAEPRFDVLKADDHAFWETVATQLQLLQPHASGVSASDLQRAFTAAVEPGEVLLDRPLPQVLLQASGYQILGAGQCYYAVARGVKADFEAEHHNYLGFFSTEEDAMAEVVDFVVAKTLAHHQVTAEAFDALAVEEKWRLVSQAHPETKGGDQND